MLLKLFIPSLLSWSSSDVLLAPPTDRGAHPFAVVAGGVQTPSTRFPKGLIVSGDLNADEDVVIDGLVSGTIDMPTNALTIGPDAEVDARVLARDVTIFGTLRGKVTALEILDIRPGARLNGEFAAPSIALADGAQVQGRVETKRVDAAMHVARYRTKSAQQR
jgi:cytoskeletal protein CcmA (bactofilin family)